LTAADGLAGATGDASPGCGGRGLLPSPSSWPAFWPRPAAVPRPRLKAAQSRSRQSAELAHTSCIRAHGVPNFPDPQPGGGYARSAINAIGGQNSSQLQSAQKALPRAGSRRRVRAHPGPDPAACPAGNGGIGLHAQARRAGHARSERAGPGNLSAWRAQPEPAAIPGRPEEMRLPQSPTRVKSACQGRNRRKSWTRTQPPAAGPVPPPGLKLVLARSWCHYTRHRYDPLRLAASAIPVRPARSCAQPPRPRATRTSAQEVSKCEALVHLWSGHRRTARRFQHRVQTWRHRNSAPRRTHPSYNFNSILKDVPCQFVPVTGLIDRAKGTAIARVEEMGTILVGWAPPPVVSPITWARPCACRL
jgi:hypothetical protein